jgi:hypothetical protein
MALLLLYPLSYVSKASRFSSRTKYKKNRQSVHSGLPSEEDHFSSKDW